ncbi:MAG: biopolymer transporter ExbD [Pseudomonadota bacterium]
MPAPTFARPSRLATKSSGRTLIGLTPLIDVVFILLVFFMLASNFSSWQSIDLSTPSVASGGSSERALLIEITPLGFRFAGETRTFDDIIAEVADRLQSRPEQAVIVRTSNGVALQRSVDVLDALATIGATNLSLAKRP